MLEYFKSKTFRKNKTEKEDAKEAVQQPEVETGDKLPPPDVKTTLDDEQHDQTKTDIPSDVQNEHRSSSDHPFANPVLDKDDESWLRSILEDDSPPPPLPPRVKTPEIELSDTDSASLNKKSVELTKSDDEEDKTTGNDKEDDKQKKKKEKKEKKEKEKEEKEKNKDEKHQNRLTLLFHRNKKHGDSLKPEDAALTEKEVEKEKNDLGSVLERLNLEAKNNKIVSLSNDTSDLLQRFTQVFKDLVNGVPTAYGDLTSLFDDRDGALNRGFEKLPSSLKKLVTQLPEKLTSSLAPELLAAAAESQGLRAETEAGVKEATKKLLTPQNLTELVTKPGAIVSMLKAIVNALKLRWPAVMGTNVVWSVALFLLMFVLWYCHKRGREVRLEKEKADGETPIDGSDRVEELPDDPLLPAPESTTAVVTKPVPEEASKQLLEPAPAGTDLPHPPIGQDAPAEPSRA